MQLPAQFLLNIKSLLRDNADDFKKAMQKEPLPSLRINTLKADKDALNCFDVPFSQVAWCGDGYYYPASFKAGKTALHLAGAYYIQEASAMLPATVLGAEPGDKVLDLCAAPGGKSTQIACALKGSGLLVSNEIIPSRAAILSQNIERCGIRNAIVTCASPQILEKRFPAFFDKILVDAPCSGEGMFRKNPEACEEWTDESPSLCAQRQLCVLESALTMLKSGGKLVYSTCTFSKEENEEVINALLEKHPQLSLIPVNCDIPQPVLYDVNADEAVIKGCVRIMPHLAQGEGHFCAAIRKNDGEEKKYKLCSLRKNAAAQKAVKDFCKKYLNCDLEPDLFFGDTVYSAPQDCPDLNGLKVLRAGLCLGEIIKGRFEPSHSLALALTPSDVKNVVDLAEASPDVNAYLLGNTLPCELDGWTLVCVNGISLGWGKANGGILKNKLPKGLRINK